MAALAACAWLGGAWFASDADAQGYPSPMGPPPAQMDFTAPYPDQSGQASYIPSSNGVGVGGFGAKGRIGHLAGRTVGRTDSITYFDLSPYMFVDDSLLFGEARLFLANNGHVGGTAGGGLRHYFDEWNTVFGLSGYYDGDDSRGQMFQQFGVSGEIFTEWLDIRSNVYLPYGKEEAILSQSVASGSEMFVGNNIQFQRRITSATAMQGFDVMFTAPIPGEMAQTVNLEATAGFYFYHPDTSILKDAWGWKVRGDADLVQGLSHTFLEISHDKVFDTNVMFGIDINYWGHLEPPVRRVGVSQYNRMAQWVRRNRSVVVQETSALGTPELAINPDTGNPYLVYHVRNNPTPPPDNFPAPTGDGSIDMPFQYMQEAIDATPFADIVFVQANSVFDGTVDGNANATATLRENVMVLGEGAPITIPVQGLSDPILLPTVTEGAINLPVIQNVIGPVITMADNSRFAGFDITNVSDDAAILFDGVNNADVEEVNISNVTGVNGDGIRVNQSSGVLTFQNISIDGAEGTGFLVREGTASVVFEGTNTINNTDGFSVVVEGAAGAVNLQESTITDSGLGIRVQEFLGVASTANVTFGTVSLTNTNAGTAAEGILIEDHNGSVSFTGPLSIDANNGDAFVVRNLQNLGAVNLNDSVAITNRNAGGIVIENILEGINPNTGLNQAGQVNFQQPLLIGSALTATADPAFLFDSSFGSVNLIGTTNINNTNATGTGIEITDSLGATGTSSPQFLASSLITIGNSTGTAFTVHDIAKSNSRVATFGLTVNNRLGNALGINVSDYAGNASFTSVTTVNNQQGIDGTAISVINNTGDTTFATVNVNDVAGAGFFGVQVENNRATDPDESVVGFGTLNVTSTLANAVSLLDNDRVSVVGGTLDVTAARAVDVQDNDRHDITFTEVTADGQGTADFGILVDGLGTFTVTGLNNVAGSGGAIDNMTVAGASFANTGDVELNLMDYTGNNRAIIAENMIVEVFGDAPELVLDGLTIDSSTNEAIVATDVATFRLRNSLLTDNGTTNSENQIEFIAGVDEADIDGDGDDEDPVEYLVELDNNSITDPAGTVTTGTDMIAIRTDNTRIGDGARLDLFITDNGTPPNAVNSLTMNRTGQAAVGVDWTGNLNASILRNTFVLLDGDDQVGVRLDIDGPADVVFSNNSLSASGDDATGLLFNFEESAAVEISNNRTLDDNAIPVNGSGFLFTGLGSTGVDLNFRATNNDVFFNGNLIQFTGNAFDGTGMIVRRVFAPSTFRINDNEIDLITDLDAVVERGIFFQDVRGVINLIGNQDNFITPGTFLPFINDFSIPNGTSTGSIIINGAPRP